MQQTARAKRTKNAANMQIFQQEEAYFTGPSKQRASISLKHARFPDLNYVKKRIHVFTFRPQVRIGGPRTMLTRLERMAIGRKMVGKIPKTSGRELVNSTFHIQDLLFFLR